MELTTAVRLLQTEYILQPQPTTWADLGCGSGMFTEALSHYLKSESTIYAIDKNNGVKDHTTDGDVKIASLLADFVNDNLPLPKLDGILLANSFHYVKDKVGLVKKIAQHQKENACFLIVEYDTDSPVRNWVPYPISYISLKIFFENQGYTTIKKLHHYPSAFGGNMFSAIIKK